MNYNDFLNSYKTEYFDLRYFRDIYISVQIIKIIVQIFETKSHQLTSPKLLHQSNWKSPSQIKISQCYKKREEKKERKIEYDPLAINRITRLAGTPRQAQVYINTYLEGLYGFSRRVTSICNRSIYFSTQPIFSLLPLPFNPSQSSPSATFLSRVPSLSSFFFFFLFFNLRFNRRGRFQLTKTDPPKKKLRLKLRIDTWIVLHRRVQHFCFVRKTRLGGGEEEKKLNEKLTETMDESAAG